MEECLHSETISLPPGTYMLGWEGECSLCTRHHCIPGTINTGSTLRLNNSWQAVNIPKIPSFADLKLPSHLGLPSKLSEIKTLNLDDLMSESLSSIKWSNAETSLTIDITVMFVIIAVIIISVIMYCRYCHKGVADKENICLKTVNKSTNLSDAVNIPLMELVNKPELAVHMPPKLELYPATCVLSDKNE